MVDDGVTGINQQAISQDDMPSYQHHTEKRVKNILNMLTHLENAPSPIDSRAEKDISKSQRLLDLYEQLRDKMVSVLAKRGVSVRLPSEHPNYVDASGKQWGDAELKDDFNFLRKGVDDEMNANAKDLAHENQNRVQATPWVREPTSTTVNGHSQNVRPQIVAKGNLPIDRENGDSTNDPWTKIVGQDLGPKVDAVEANVACGSCSTTASALSSGYSSVSK